MTIQYDEWGEPIETPTTEDTPPTETEQPTANEPVIVGDWNLTKAVEYATYHAIDNEDFLGGDETQQVRFLNVARRTLARAYKDYVIPIEAEYLFACVLNANYNDTAIMAHRGIASFNVSGIGFTFKDWAKKELSEFITEEIADMVNDANPDKGGGSGRVKWVTL